MKFRISIMALAAAVIVVSAEHVGAGVPPTGGTQTPGYYNPIDSRWYQINENAFGVPVSFFRWSIGIPGVIPLVGDWDGDGEDTPGFYNPADSRWYQINENSFGAPVSFFRWSIGIPGVIPLVGDWDGDGDDTPGFFNPADNRWYQINENAFGAPVSFFRWSIGIPGAVPVVGDWDGAGGTEGTTTPGYYNSADSRWYRINDNAFGAPVEFFRWSLGIAGVTPLVGDWDGNADNGSGSTPGYLNTGDSRWYQINENAFGAPVNFFRFSIGIPGVVPIVGDWDGTTVAP
jgi:uncharacterized protein YbaR (Trm112 family)